MGCGASTDAIANEDAVHDRGPLLAGGHRGGRNTPSAYPTLDMDNSPAPGSPRSRKLQSLLLPHRGMKCSREFAAMLPDRFVEEGGTAAQYECPICAVNLGGCYAVTLPCLHTYHRDCALRWLTRHEGTCPECRTRVGPESFEPPAYNDAAPSGRAADSSAVTASDVSLGGLMVGNIIRAASEVSAAAGDEVRIDEN